MKGLQKSQRQRCGCRHKKKVTNSFDQSSSMALVQLYTNSMSKIQQKDAQITELLKQQTSVVGEVEESKKQGQTLQEQGNQFLGEQQLSKSQAKKLKMIERLKQNNRVLTNEVQKVWQKMKEMSDKDKKGRPKVVGVQSSRQQLQNELKVAYKWIKMTQKQLASVRKKQQQSPNPIDKLKSLKKQFAQKQVISSSLKHKILIQTRQLSQLQQKLSSLKNEANPTAELAKMTEQISYLYQVWKEGEKKEEKKVETLKKQYQMVKKMEKMLVQKGISGQELEAIKKKCIRQVSPSKHKYNASITQRTQSRTKQSPSKTERPEPRTLTLYNQMLLQISLYQKHQQQSTNQLSLLSLQKQKYATLNTEVKDRLVTYEQEIDKLEILVEQLRSRRIKQHRRKQRMRSLQAERGEDEKRRERLMKREELVKVTNMRGRRFKSLPNSSVAVIKSFTQLQQQEQQEAGHQSSLLMMTQTIANQNKQQLTTQHSIVARRHYSYGVFSADGNKFSDGYILGKQNQTKKITQIILYFLTKHKQTQWLLLAGISVGYQGGIKGGQYIWRTQHNQNQYQLMSYQCEEGQYIKDIHVQCINVKGQEEGEVEGGTRIVGVEIQLSRGERKRFGWVQEYQSKLQDKQYVTCIYGTMAVIQQGQHKLSLIEQLAMLICE